MEYIKSKDLCMLIRDTLKLIDRRLMDHGSRTAYIVCKMLERRGGFEHYEIADLLILLTLHDIGAYKTDQLAEMLRVECKDYMPHSVYGYLFYKYLSPHEEYAKILLYHHMDYSQTKGIDYPYMDIANYLNFAEKVDIYYDAMGDNFDYHKFEQYKGTRFSPESYDLFEQVMKETDLFEQIKTERYQHELDEMLDYVLFSDEEKNGYLQMLMYCLGFRSEHMVVDSVTTICICKEIGKLVQITAEEQECLYYGALLHDLGMLSIPGEFIISQSRLTPKQQEFIRAHVDRSEKVLRNRLYADAVDVAITHHERLDGSGYPRGLKAAQMNRMDFILQVADKVTVLANGRGYSRRMNKEEIIGILKAEETQGQLSEDIIDTFCGFYDMIMDRVREESEEILKMHTKLQKQYELICLKFKR